MDKSLRIFDQISFAEWKQTNISGKPRSRWMCHLGTRAPCSAESGTVSSCGRVSRTHDRPSRDRGLAGRPCASQCRHCRNARLRRGDFAQASPELHPCRHLKRTGRHSGADQVGTCQQVRPGIASCNVERHALRHGFCRVARRCDPLQVTNVRLPRSKCESMCMG